MLHALVGPTLRDIIAICFALIAVWGGQVAVGAEPASFEELQADYAARAQPLLTAFCLECHATEAKEGELDLERFSSLRVVRGDPSVWQRVAEMLDNGEMPPEDARQPAAAERRALRDWVGRYLHAEARAHAGDPGPVVLRRLNNAQYTYTLRDLTGLKSLQPAREFPVDGGAGEGFTNTGNSLGMSPSLVTKYLEAAKQIATHAVLLPEGIRFSEYSTRRDWTNELLEQIRAFYRAYTEPLESSQIQLQGLIWESADGGRIPLRQYLAATLDEREKLRSGDTTIEVVAQQRGLSSQYLGLLWRALNDGQPSPLLDPLRIRWREASAEDVAPLITQIGRWQQRLWTFRPVGHIGKVGGPTAWQEAISPRVAQQEVRLALLPTSDTDVITLYLATTDAGDGNEDDQLIWQQPRFVAPGRPDVPLRDIRDVTGGLTRRRQQLFEGAQACLAAAAAQLDADNAVDVASLAQKHGVETDVLRIWLDYLGLSTEQPSHIDGYLTVPIRQAAGYDFIQGWGSGGDTPNLVTNASDQHVRIPGNMPPHSVAVHPSPTLRSAVGWRSPEALTLRIEGTVQPAHPECGNGVTWSLELRHGTRRQELAAGTAQGDHVVAVGPIENVKVKPDDLLSLLIGPRDGNHACDLTQIDLTLTAEGKEPRGWNLTRDVSSNVLDGNPHGDGEGKPEIWHFYTEATAEPLPTESLAPADSLLSRWRAAETEAERGTLAAALQSLLTTGRAVTDASPDAELYRQLASFRGPLLTTALRIAPPQSSTDSPATGPDEAVHSDEPVGNDQRWGIAPARFGNGIGIAGTATSIDPTSIAVQAPAVLEIRLPADLVAGTEFVATATLSPGAAGQGSVQVVASLTRPPLLSTLDPELPIITHDDSAARDRIEAALAEFRKLFPAACCYTRIVPVDEVVTLTLFYREDEPLRRLLLNSEQTAQLDRLWHELHYVSQDALTLVDAFDQLWQYATQDADPSAFEPLRQPILDSAATFRQELVSSEPAHVEAVIRFAAQAYRRVLVDKEADDLRALYRALRAQDVAHEDAIRLLLVRVLVSPAFLYRADDSRPSGPVDQDAVKSTGMPPIHAVSDWELATRLSYFLWSSSPDAQLREAAARGGLHEPEQLVAQTRRLLTDDRVRRLATEFACQWLHIYDFDTHDEKSESLFPSFGTLRGAMYEESIRFFADLFQRDGSVLEILDADHTFVNEELAKHYDLTVTGGLEWQRVEGLRQHGRGGVLGMSAILAKQSGASRTSPILRGNWICEVILGDRLPRPPKGVPQLPDVLPTGLTERQLIEQHTASAACAKCHVRIDPLGFSLEAFDAIGRDRRHAAQEAAIDTSTTLADGTPIDGLEGLRTYLLTVRRDDFVRQFCRKLLGYALGRAVQLSDEPLLEAMQTQLQANDYRIRTAVEAIVLSKQFTHTRAAEASEDTRPAPY